MSEDNSQSALPEGMAVSVNPPRGPADGTPRSEIKAPGPYLPREGRPVDPVATKGVSSNEPRGPINER